MKLGIAGVVVALFDRLVSSHATSYDPSDGTLTVSVPNLGPKSLDVTSDEIHDFVAVLDDFDPTVTSAERPLAQIVAGTLSVDDGVVSFRCSDQKGARTVRVPLDEWADFCRFWRAAADSVDDTIENYQVALAAAEADANSK